MTRTITKQIVPDQNKYSFGTGNPVNYITVHQTSNWNYGAGAKGHANLQSRMNVGYGWHYQVDDTYIIQSYEDTYKVWHAGDGDGKGNTQSIGIEICVNPDSDYKVAFLNSAWLVATKMKEHNVPIEHVVQHNYWIGKDCPIDIRAGKFGLSWSVFLNQVKEFYNASGKTKAEIKVGTEKDTLYKVQIGAFSKKENANRTLELAKSKGFNAFIAEENGLYKVQIGAFANHDNAKKQADKAKKSGLTVYITNMINVVKPKLKPIGTVAKEVIRGDWGNGASRKEALIKAGYNYNEVQREVNRKLY